MSPILRTPVTLAVSIIALAANFAPGLAGALELDIAAVACGQWWRMLTGHLTHYDSQHLFWDLLMFVVLATACERRHPGSFLWKVVGMTWGISIAIGFWCPEILVYRGLSGLDTGLFVWFVADQCRASWIDRDRMVAVLWLLPVAGLIGKLIFEAMSGQTLFVDSSGFTPLVQSHLAGAVLGFLIAIEPVLSRFVKLPFKQRRLDADVFVP